MRNKTWNDISWTIDLSPLFNTFDYTFVDNVMKYFIWEFILILFYCIINLICLSIIDTFLISSFLLLKWEVYNVEILSYSSKRGKIIEFDKKLSSSLIISFLKLLCLFLSSLYCRMHFLSKIKCFQQNRFFLSDHHVKITLEYTSRQLWKDGMRRRLKKISYSFSTTINKNLVILE